MFQPSPHHRAQYDADGNIIVPGPSALPPAAVPAPAAMPLAAAPVYRTTEEVIWVEIPEPGSAAEESLRTPAAATRSKLRILTRLTKEMVDEGIRQYASIPTSRPALFRFRESARNAARFLRQPVWVPGRKKLLKEYSRGTLFVVDIVRFGGTFAAIFAGLFVALNYQSFWQITQSKLESAFAGPALTLPDEKQEELGAAFADKARARGELMAYLPTVGPPQDRVVIPKLNLNVPLVTPSYESLLRQDWPKVEEDIQDALQKGVVHYPGTAQPAQAGNFFVTGHSSYYPWAPGEFKTVFARLHELEPGDEFFVYYKGDKHRYVVRTKKEVLPSDVTVLDQPENKRIATLMTCTPIGTTLRRLIVQAEEVDLKTGIALKVGERGEALATPRPQLEALPI